MTEKEFGMLVPALGIFVNGGLNVMFQQVGHTTAKDYFRLIILGEKYGNEKIDKLLGEEIRLLKANKSA